jgi:NAD(P)-dependent dehydrogenase (short-subunit alcohol dehydrogenase family)
MRLAGKKAVITGAGSGIGRASALRFAEEGAAVAVADIRREAAEDTVEQITVAGGRAIALQGDVSKAEECAAMIAQAEKDLGGLTVMFNNAGVCLPDDEGPENTPLATWERTLEINLTGVFLCCKFAIPALLRAGGGSVINMASIVAHVGSSYPQIAYTAAKGGVLAMTRELAIQYARRGLRFNAISPGPVKSALSDQFFSDEQRWLSRRRYMPMGRLGTPDEIAPLVVFLASDESSYVNGAVIPVDGGCWAKLASPTFE